MYKVIIASSKGFDNYILLKSELVKLLRRREPSEIEIVSSVASHSVHLSERYANEKGCNLKQFPVDINVNEEMAKYANVCLVFMQGESSEDTQSLISSVRKEGVPVKVVYC